MIRPLLDDCTFGPTHKQALSAVPAAVPEVPGCGSHQPLDAETEQVLRRLTEEIIRHSPELAALLVAAATHPSLSTTPSAGHS